MTHEKKQVPDWVAQQFCAIAKEHLKQNHQYVMEWIIKKNAMIAALNYCRGQGLCCKWTQKREDCFTITITNKQ